jgi:hypothetical protein
MKRLFSWMVAVLLGLPMSVSAQPTAPEKAKLLEFFETKVRPVLAEHCYACHGGKKQQGGVRLDSRAAAVKTGDDGAAVVPGHPDKSLLVRALRYEGEIKMPPKAKLPQAVIDDLTTWIQLGAVWPDEKNITTKGGVDASKHWAFQPVRKPDVPKVSLPEWAANPVDALVLAKLDAKGLKPNAPADRRTLLRRLKFDLLGIPPTYDEVKAFESDTSPNAFEKRVDQYLASPQYGERWARHWLDVARYADTKGYVFQEERRYAYAYAYRDWVIKAFNDDLPYDQFLVQQLAADRLVAAKQAPASSQAAMGFLTLGRRFLNNSHDIIDDRIDVVSRGLMGLTVACARCHDHKYDPIPTKDYYSLYGVFSSSTEPKDLPLLGEPEKTPEYVAFQGKVQELEKAVTEFKDKNKKELDAKNRKFQDDLRALQKKVDGFKATSPFAPARGMVLVDSPNPGNARVLNRGNPGNPGAVVPRQFLEVLSGPKREPFKDGSGRLELARAVASKDNPLTPRVFVNRVWLHHFGAPLVSTPSDFGVRSDPPSHPELLDYLAAQFVEDGWSIKKLHRRIVLSRVYQMSSDDHPQAAAADAENRLLARANRRRLEFESLRDSLLAVSGQLDTKLYGPAVDLTKAPFPTRRTIYGFIDRQNLPGLFRTFDFASPDATNPQRYQTTVPQQALFLLNHPFVQEQAKKILARPDVADADRTAKIQKLHRLLYARDADADEVRLGLRFIETTATTPGLPRAVSLSEWERYTQALVLANEFVFVD